MLSKTGVCCQRNAGDTIEEMLEMLSRDAAQGMLFVARCLGMLFEYEAAERCQDEAILYVPRCASQNSLCCPEEES